ncbi:MAG: insulinase family protein [Saprospiraceae bacterium]|nr:insulinase family protein [Saprospiraceae bacterium]
MRLQLFLSFLCFSSIIMAQNTFPLDGKLPSDKDVLSGTLPNGMKYFIKKNVKPENRAELRLAVKAGSLQEDEDQLGIAHFVEHMAFNGSKNFKKNELIDYLESIGTRFGADLNAYTSFEETVYMIQARTDSLNLLEKGLLIMEDWAYGISFEEEEIDKERGVVISEWRTGLSADQRMQQQYFPIAYKDSRYAERLPIGKPEIIQEADYSTIRRFYQDWYRPDLMAIIAVGDFDLEWMENQIKSRFAKVPKKADPRPREKYDIPSDPSTRYAICTDEEATFSNIRVMYRHPHIKVKTVADYKGTLARNLYNRMLNSRMIEIQQQADPPFTFAYTGYGQDMSNLDNYYLYAFVKEGGMEKGIKAVLRATRQAYLHGFHPSELERQKQEILRAAEKAANEQDKTPSAGLASGFVYHFLKGNAIPTAKQRLALLQQLLPLISVEDINPLPKQWIRPEERVVIVTGPDTENNPLPTESALESWLDEFDKMDVPAYEDNVVAGPMIQEELSSVPIVAEHQEEEFGLTEWRLENGVRVVLKPTDFKNDEILMTAWSPGGYSNYKTEDLPSATNAVPILVQSGIGPYDYAALNKQLTGKNAGVGPFISELYEGLSGNSSKQDLEMLFQLTYLYTTAPRKDQDAFASYISRQKSIFENIMTNPYNYFGLQKQKIKYNDHPRRQITNMETLEKINLDKILQVYRDRFADASDFSFFFVGSFTLEEMKPLVQKYLGNLPSNGRKEGWKNVGVQLQKGQIDTTFVKGRAPKALVEMIYHNDFQFDADNRYALGSLASLLRIKLREAMREDEGGVYGVSVRAFSSQYPKPGYNVRVSFNAAPEEVDKLIEITKLEIDKIKDEGALDKDITKIIETQKQGRIKNLKQNRYWLGQLSYRYQNNIPLDGLKLEVLEEYTEKLDSDLLKKAARKYLNTENFMQFLLLPESDKP